MYEDVLNEIGAVKWLCTFLIPFAFNILCENETLKTQKSNVEDITGDKTIPLRGNSCRVIFHLLFVQHIALDQH